jgi:hypothetical protein
MSGSDPSSTTKPERTSDWSSTTATRITAPPPPAQADGRSRGSRHRPERRAPVTRRRAAPARADPRARLTQRSGGNRSVLREPRLLVHHAALSTAPRPSA